MSEFEKLSLKFQVKDEKRHMQNLKAFMIALGELQHDCKHKKTHWIQELAKDGSTKSGLFKRCFICGSTIDTLESDPEFLEEIMIQFDNSVEHRKQHTTPVSHKKLENEK